MTSPTLVLESSTQATEVSPAKQPGIATQGVDAAKRPPASPSAQRLPYNKTQQLELLHLQAEAEALLQQVQVLTQQKQPPINV
ncbi:MAG: hypothetical protein AAFX78_04425 [Cyanobacteria bacterium J06638_20]